MISKTLYFDQTRLETIGTGSILGLLLEQWQEGKLPNKVVLEFPQSSLEKRRKTGGPEALLVWEYTIPCILKDVLRLIEMGILVEIVTTEKF